MTLALMLVASAPLEVLVFSRTTGFRHDSIPDGIAMVRELGEQAGWRITATEDPSVFSADGLRNVRVVIFLNTTGDVLNSPQESAMEAWLRQGRGFVGIHSAADTEYQWPFYGQLVGAYFKSHPHIQNARVKIEDRNDPCCSHLLAIWERTDEWYCFRSSPRPNVKVLGSLDTSSYQGSTMGADHPIFWKHELGRARSFYTGMGHTKGTYREPLFREKIRRAIVWAGRL